MMAAMVRHLQECIDGGRGKRREKEGERKRKKEKEGERKRKKEKERERKKERMWWVRRFAESEELEVIMGLCPGLGIALRTRRFLLLMYQSDG